MCVLAAQKGWFKIIALRSLCGSFEEFLLQNRKKLLQVEVICVSVTAALVSSIDRLAASACGVFCCVSSFSRLRKANVAPRQPRFVVDGFFAWFSEDFFVTQNEIRENAASFVYSKQRRARLFSATFLLFAHFFKKISRDIL
jgi:hypothetical protein